MAALHTNKITPCLWFDTQAEDAAEHYTRIFKNSRIVHVSRYGSAGPRPAGMVMVVHFQIDGQDFVALNGGPEFTIDEAISFQVNCESQAELDTFWTKLSEGGEEGPCGWVKDKFGVSWQIVPTALMRLLGDKDRARANRATQAMLKMVKLDIELLKQAYEQR